MKRVFVNIGLMAAVMTTAAASCGGSGKTAREPVVDTGIDTLSEATEKESEDEDCGCYGDTLTQYGDKTYMVDYWEEENDFKGFSNTFIVTCQGNERLDTCRVDGGSIILSAEGKTLKVAIGVDTVQYDITRLPKRIDPLKELVTANCRKHIIDHTFSIRWLSDSSSYCQFRFYGFLPT